MDTTSAPFKSRSGRALVLVGLYVIGAILGAFVMPLIGSAAAVVTGAPQTASITPMLLIAALLVAPAIEEFVYRWLPFLLIDQRPRLAIFVGALAFGATHWPTHPSAGVVAFVAGLLLGWVYARSRIIWDSVAMHAGMNAGAFGLAALLGSGVA